MTLQTLAGADAERLFAVIRDSDFGWVVDDVPTLMATLGWTIAEAIPGKGAVADTPWGIPDADVDLLYRGDVVQSVTIRVTSRGTGTPADRLAVVDAFAAMTNIATRALGPATATIPGDVPRTQWRRERATATIQNTGNRVLIDWCRNEYQDFNDSVGRY